MKMKLRFPPSPTGHLHVGNVRTALYNWLLAKKHNGEFVVRIEDTDAERSTRENEERLLEDLRWLGLDWTEGPEVGGDNGPYRQSERLEIYNKYIETLLAEGKAYYCFCTPEELEADRQQALAEKRPPIYSGKYRDYPAEKAAERVAAGEPAAIRFKVEDGAAIAWKDLVHGDTSFERGVIGDFVFVRSDGMPAYNFAVVVDDALMGITHVIRGDDHISNTPRQILLYQSMNFDVPSFAHLPMILGPDGSRLSKRHGATSVEEFRKRGYLPKALLNFLALLGWNPGNEQELFSESELIEAFGLERVNKAAAIFNFEKLDWLNGQVMRTMKPEDLLPHLVPLLKERGMIPEQMNSELEEWYLALVETFNGGSVLTDIVDGCELAFHFDVEKDLVTPETQEVLETEEAREVISEFNSLLRDADHETDFTAESFKAIVKQVQKNTGHKGKMLFHPVRIAITGKTAGPELGKLVPLLENGRHLHLPFGILGLRERVALTASFLGLE
jgi:nondiscriminating glutamyl-tRNA synthetase